MRQYHIGSMVVTIAILLISLGASSEEALSQNSGQDPEASAPTTPDEPSFAPDRILVKTKEDAATEAIETVNRKNNARTEKRIPRTQVKVVKLPEDLSVQEAVKRYEASPDVEYAEPDYEVYPAQSYPTPDDPRYSNLYGLNNTGQNKGTLNADIDAPEAWSVTNGDASTVVAVIDTGVDVKHPDLKDNIWVNPGESGTDSSGNDKATNGVDDDVNGYKDDVNGWDFANDDNSVFDRASDDSHGTHVAGTIAAEGNNDLGVVGVNWRAKVMSAKFIGPGDVGYISDAIEALNYAVANGVKISNNSWGHGTYFSQSMLNAIKAADGKGHLFVAAAMNDSADNDVATRYPSGYNSPNIISVAATDNNDSLASFSNYGATSVDLAAPGVYILSTLPGNTYGYYNGTSMATPHVAGTAALIKANSPNLDDAGIKNRILSSADPRASLAGKTATGGRLSAARALGVNTAPMITNTRPGSKTRDRTPTISATVRDDETDLTESNISLYVDGQPITDFTYDQTTDKLTYTSPHLSRTRHTVEIVVIDDPQEPGTTKTWSFRIRR